MTVRAVLFDLDHTLIHSPLDFPLMRAEVMAALAEFGVVVADAAQKLILEVVDEAAGRLGEPAAQALRATAEQRIQAVELAAAAEAEPIPGVAEALRILRADGRRIGIITRNCRPVVTRALQRVPLVYDVLITREETSRVKPAPEHAWAALEALHTPSGRAVLVGDFRADMECAVAAGVVPVGVLTGRPAREELLAAGAVAVLPSVAELPAWLAERGW